MLSPSIYPLAITAVVLLAIAAEDYSRHSVKTTRSLIYQAAIVLCVLLNFAINWQLALILLVVGLALYFTAIPIVKQALKQYNYKLYDLDKEIFLLTLVGWPFISLFAFLGNQLANIAYNLGRKVVPNWGEEMPQLVVYGIIWFIIAVAVLALYIH